MSRYTKVARRIWSDARFCSLTRPQPNGQDCFLFLLTGLHNTVVPGLFSAGEAGLAEALGWSLEDFRRCFAELDGMVQADWRARLVWLPNAIRHNSPQSYDNLKAWGDAWAELPECPLKGEAWESLRAFFTAKGPKWAQAFAKACPRPEVPLVLHEGGRAAAPGHRPRRAQTSLALGAEPTAGPGSVGQPEQAPPQGVTQGPFAAEPQGVPQGGGQGLEASDPQAPPQVGGIQEIAPESPATDSEAPPSGGPQSTSFPAAPAAPDASVSQPEKAVSGGDPEGVPQGGAHGHPKKKEKEKEKEKKLCESDARAEGPSAGVESPAASPPEAGTRAPLNPHSAALLTALLAHTSLASIATVAVADAASTPLVMAGCPVGVGAAAAGALGRRRDLEAATGAGRHSGQLAEELSRFVDQEILSWRQGKRDYAKGGPGAAPEPRSPSRKILPPIPPRPAQLAGGAR